MAANPLYSAEEFYINDELVTELVIPDTVTEIKAYTFYDCAGITKLVISDSVTSIGIWAFAGCDNIETVVLGENVTSIGKYAFYQCSYVTTVYYKGTESAWDEIVIDVDNAYLSTATRYYYSAEEPASNDEGTAYNGNYWYVDEEGNVNVWDEVEFNEPDEVYSEGLEYELSADGESYVVVGIGSCTDTDIIIPSVYEGKPVTAVKNMAFYGCASLTSVVFGANVTTIETGAFYQCAGLTYVVFGANVTTIANGAFAVCSDLTSVYYNGTESDWAAIAFGPDNFTTATIYYFSAEEPALNDEGTAYNGDYWCYDEDGVICVWEYEVVEGGEEVEGGEVVEEGEEVGELE
jgi:hypothetical protein